MDKELDMDKVQLLDKEQHLVDNRRVDYNRLVEGSNLVDCNNLFVKRYYNNYYYDQTRMGQLKLLHQLKAINENYLIQMCDTI